MPNILDPAQLKRIEAVHRGFLYQHLYAVGCLLLAQKAGVKVVMVELDEDIELITEQERIYVQVKTRSKPIVPSNVSGALKRFDELRNQHAEGKRNGRASFVVVANQAPSEHLQLTIDDNKLPNDIFFVFPNSIPERNPALPPAWESLTDAIAWCTAQAEELNFSLLSPETLIWKLAGLAQYAATGGAADNHEHAFHTQDLPDLFEQLVVQLQDFPSPPAPYRPQKLEPPLASDERVRIICGLSGAGKTAWAAQAALHNSQPSAYYDTGDLPGPALAGALVRELTAKFAARDKDGMRKILLPGASGYEALSTFDTVMEQQGMKLWLILDNAHRIPSENLRGAINATKSIHFILLCQPKENVRELEALLGIQREDLSGWDLDTVAAAARDFGGFATATGYEQLRLFTGGLPMYVQSAAKVATQEYVGNIDALCSDLQQNNVETAQEVILSRVYDGFDKLVQETLALLSLSDLGLSLDEVSELLVNSLKIPKSRAAVLIKKARATGTIEEFGNKTLKVHDAIRGLALQHLELLDPALTQNALIALKELLVTSLEKYRDTSRFALLTQIYIKLDDVMTLIALSGEELFYEMGIQVDIMAALDHASSSGVLNPFDKFWALDGLVFSDIREGGPQEKLGQRLGAMEALLDEYEFGYREQIAYAMKRILFATESGDFREVSRLVEQARPNLPDAESERIFDYNYAIALWKLGNYSKAETLCWKVVEGYYEIFGIRPQDVMGKNSDALWTLIKQPEDVQNHIKHLADALELHAINCEALGKSMPFSRIHSMKFYNMAQAPESMVRVGQDLADEFVGRKDPVGAKMVMEEQVLPVVQKAGLVKRLVQVRSQYAVILAMCGQHRDATAEMQRLEPYLEGLANEQRQEIENQRNKIAELAHGAPMGATVQLYGKVGRNAKCPCGSGLKYKKCHGA